MAIVGCVATVPPPSKLPGEGITRIVKVALQWVRRRLARRPSLGDLSAASSKRSSPRPSQRHESPRPADYRERVAEALEAKSASAEWLLQQVGVNGIGVGFRWRGDRETDEIAVQVFVEEKFPLPTLRGDRIPPELQAPSGRVVPTDVLRCHRLIPLSLIGHQRPIVGGISIGSVAKGACGTLGGFARDADDNSLLILTANHVLSAADGPSNLPTDRRILQPGGNDGGRAPQDVIGETTRVTHIRTGSGPALAPQCDLDAAVGSVGECVEQVEHIGRAVSRIGHALPLDVVQKTGRTTELTRGGRVTTVGAQFRAEYGPGQWAIVGGDDTVFIVRRRHWRPFAQPGDSGAILFDQNAQDTGGPRALGLIFGVASGWLGGVGALVFANQIDEVFKCLNLTTI